MTGKRRGRPPINDTALGRRTVYLTLDELVLLNRLGNGNISAGVRQALKLLDDYEQWHHDRMNPAIVAGPSPRSTHQ